MGPTWGPPGSCRLQVGPMLATWALLWGRSKPRVLMHLHSWISIISSIDCVTSLIGVCCCPPLEISSRTCAIRVVRTNKKCNYALMYFTINSFLSPAHPCIPQLIGILYHSKICKQTGYHGGEIVEIKQHLPVWGKWMFYISAESGLFIIHGLESS